MRKDGEGERGPTEARNFNPSREASRRNRVLSFSTADKTDAELLLLFRERESTVLSVSKKVGISFVECLHRARRLERLGLLERLDNPPSPGGLYLYVARL